MAQHNNGSPVAPVVVKIRGLKNEKSFSDPALLI